MQQAHSTSLRNNTPRTEADERDVGPGAAIAALVSLGVVVAICMYIAKVSF